jgi:hypothetical protein
LPTAGGGGDSGEEPAAAPGAEAGDPKVVARGTLAHEGTTYRLLEGPGLAIEHCGEELRVTQDAIRVRNQDRPPMSARRRAGRLAA